MPSAQHEPVRGRKKMGNDKEEGLPSEERSKPKVVSVALEHA